MADSSGTMKKSIMKVITILGLAWLVGVAQGQNEAGIVNVIVSEHATLGEILMIAADHPDASTEEQAVYAFVNEAVSGDMEPMTEGVRSNAAPCEGSCLDRWPPVIAESFVASEGVNEEFLYIEEVGGRTQLIYNGWPLYFFADDSEAGEVLGQGLGQGDNAWYVLDAEGNLVSAEGSGASDGAAADDATGDATPVGEEPVGDEPEEDATDEGAGSDDATSDETD